MNPSSNAAETKSATAAPAALSATGVTMIFGGQRALDEVDLEIGRGEIRALMGANGSGKSTLVKILAGLYQPEPEAIVHVASHRLSLGTAGAAEDVGLRFVHQDLGLVDELDVVDNLAMGHGYRERRAGMIRWRRETKLASDALERLGYHVDVRRLVGDLSMSERTAVAVARAVSPRRAAASMLILDEPTANLPAAEAERIFSLIRRVRDDGTAVLFVSHHFAEVFAIADSVTVLRDGRVVTTEQISGLTEDQLVTFVVGRELAKQSAAGASPQRGGEVVLSARGLTAKVLDGLNLEVRAGEIVGVAGITGSGREEVAGALFGSDPRGGEVIVNNTELAQGRPDRSVKGGLGLVPAERRSNAAFMDFSLAENVTVVNSRPNLVRGLISGGRERREVAKWLTQLRVKPTKPDEVLENLSGGNQQKVILARWLRQAPRALILDDPTQGVDIGAKAEIHRLLEAAAAEGMAVLVISTDDDELVALCHRVLVLRNGRIDHELFAPTLTTEELTACTVGAVRTAS